MFHLVPYSSILILSPLKQTTTKTHFLLQHIQNSMSAIHCSIVSVHTQPPAQRAHGCNLSTDHRVISQSISVM